MFGALLEAFEERPFEVRNRQFAVIWSFEGDFHKLTINHPILFDAFQLGLPFLDRGDVRFHEAGIFLGIEHFPLDSGANPDHRPVLESVGRPDRFLDVGERQTEDFSDEPDQGNRVQPIGLTGIVDLPGT